MAKNLQPIRIVTGGLYGSEGKGAYIDHIAPNYRTHIRVGGPQAGHSIIRPGAEKGKDKIFKLTTVPVGAFTTGTTSVIGPMSVVDPEVFEQEMEWARAWFGFYPVVIVDPRATLLDPELDVATERDAGMSDRLGSTQHGVGAARVRRIQRTAQTVGDQIDRFLAAGATAVEDTIGYVRSTAEDPLGGGVLIEAAQGHLLSLYTGGYYPYATSSECGPSQALVDAGFTFRHGVHVEATAVYRTYPIRVGGNSGPMGGQEIDWQLLRDIHGEHIPVERTTVTNKIRRVSTWDPAEARRSVETSGVNNAVLSFLDYPFPEVAGATSAALLSNRARRYIMVREAQLGVPVVAAGTSFGTYVKWHDAK